ncbi:type I glyceraldehyde-3-phosphate dehydrogenase [candidate division WWE3 bacterium CG_4_10_14_0_2_um_filter_42_7]|uniref:Type I glyceraldehyde-3-phosphate dehydrogenase n=2 Tax=Katanobacteria TaxID=422282 RepID=A0A2H0X8Z8_UNCKA|nr:MAG: type I glyceraldehyde-3-phosphate dehydrogenase [candidate division WWE3 bacterium CG08_land_8_20_14_0_20_41_15]PIZ43608.1 MAG: type I glyceraldehyde-3-phosphate dehydrogenase [candidate division WWE3 bacterium CG_4_10_14_0_2_um_filter_42_7]
MPIRVAINGFGRIGRQFYRIAAEDPMLEIVSINDLGDKENLEYLLKYDSVYPKFDKSIPHSVKFFSEKEPEAIPYKDLGVDIVLESTGFFTERNEATKHLLAGAKRVLISAPAKEPDVTLVLGVNHDEYSPEIHKIISMGSCTTNCAAPVAKVLNDHFGIKNALLTTVHAYTSNQNLVDGPARKDARRGRAAAQSIVPSTTGAAKSVVEVIPELKGKLDGIALRVPVIAGSITDFVAVVKKEVTVESVNEAFEKEAKGKLKGILEINAEGLVSSDIIGTTFSAIVDTPLTKVSRNMVKVFAWYDNEWAYSQRLVDLVKLL